MFPTQVGTVDIEPPLQCQGPRRNRLEHRRLAGVVGTGEHHVSRQPQFRLVVALEAADTNGVDHVPVPVCGVASESNLHSHD